MMTKMIIMMVVVTEMTVGYEQNLNNLRPQEKLKNYIKISPYRAVNTLRLGYKNQSVNAV